MSISNIAGKILLIVLVDVASASLTLAQQSGNYHLDQIYSIDQSGTIELVTGDADILIKGENRHDVRIIIDREIISHGLQFGKSEFSIEVRETGKSLSIVEHKRSYGASFGYTSENYKIEIYAPHGVSLDFVGDDGDYTVTAIDGSISIDADDGDITLRSCHGDNFFIRLDDGDVFMDEAKGKLIARIDDGDIEIINSTLSIIDFIGDDGKISLSSSIPLGADYSFDGDDNSYDIVVLGGGGTFEISHDDGRIYFDNNFSEVKKKEHYTSLVLPGGTAKIYFHGDDIRVDLSVTSVN